MNECLMPAGIAALAGLIAGEIKSEADLVLLAAVLTQLGDALAVIAAQRAACAERAAVHTPDTNTKF